MEGYDGRERFEVFTADEWFRTGDLFTVDGEGFFYFHGRRGDMIKTAGANVSPSEVEARAARRHRRSRRARDRPARRPNAARSSAAIVLADPDDAPDLDELRRDLRARLSAYKVPRRFAVVAPDALPMLPGGKPDLRTIVERFDEWSAR